MAERGGRQLAVTIMPLRPAHPPWQLLGCVALTLGVAAGSLFAPTPAAQWASLGLIPLSGWCGVDWVRSTARQRAKASISARLARLPDDFYLLNDLTIPAPWGSSRIDQVIVSRFGLVVICAAPVRGWMPERVEAVRSLLFTAGLAQPSLPVTPLILLPPGAQPPRQVEYGVPTVRIENLRLSHLAPGGQAVLTEDQVATIAQALLHARAVN